MYVDTIGSRLQCMYVDTIDQVRVCQNGRHVSLDMFVGMYVDT